MNWRGNEINMQELYEQVQEQYNVAQPVGDVTLSIIINAIYKKVGLSKEDFSGCKSFKDVMSRIYMLANEEMSALRDPDEIEKSKRKFASIVKMARIKPLKHGSKKA